MSSTPEGKVKDAVKKILNRYTPDLWYFMPVGGRFGRAGIPDIVGCFNGCMFAIETKAGGNNATALQTLTMGKMQSAGCATLVIDETNIDEIEPMLRRIGSTKL